MALAPYYFERIEHLVALLRKTLEPYRRAYGTSRPAQTEAADQPPSSQQILVTDLYLVLNLAILRSRLCREPAALPSSDQESQDSTPGLAIEVQAAVARQILSLRYPVPENPEKLDLLWEVYRGSLLHFLQSPPFQSPPFSMVTKREKEAALQRLSRPFAGGWDTTSQRIPTDARKGLRELQEDLDLGREGAKQVALEVGLLQALADWEEPRRIRIDRRWIYEKGAVADFRQRGLNELREVEKLFVRTQGELPGVKGFLQPVNGFAVLIRHLRRKAFAEAEAWLVRRHLDEELPGGGLTETPKDSEASVLPLEPSLVDADSRERSDPDFSLVPDDGSVPTVKDHYGALLEVADNDWSSRHREALEALTTHQEARIRRLLELLLEDSESLDMANIKQQVANEEGVTPNALEKQFSRLKKAATAST